MNRMMRMPMVCHVLGICLVLVAAVSLLIWPAPVAGATAEGVPEGMSYRINGDDTVTITSYISEDVEKLVIPAAIEGLPVTSIADRAFQDNFYIKELVIPEGILSIGKHAFRRCTGLERISLPNSITKIGDAAFHQCSALVGELKLPAGITAVSDGLFYGCEALTKVIIPDGVTAIGDDAFMCCYALEEVDLPAGITEIGAGAFSSCYMLKELILPAGITEIPDRMCIGCRSLSEIIIPDGVVSLGDKSFDGCQEVTSVHLPASLRSLGERAFYKCGSMERLILPEGLEYIGIEAFGIMDRLTEITLPESVTVIGKGAFYSCTLLTDVQLPSELTVLPEKLFSCCNALTTVEIPDSVTNIENSAFWKSGVVSITMPPSLEQLGANIFTFCTELSMVTFTGDAPDIDSYAFNTVTATVRYPADNPTWAASAGKNYMGALMWAPYASDCDHEYWTVVTPPTCEGRGYTTYTCTKCGTCFADDYTESHSFSEGQCVLCGFPQGLQYQVDGDIDCVAITGYLGDLPTVVVPERIEGMPVTSVGNSAFSSCTGLIEVILPHGLTTIGDLAFAGCRDLEGVLVPETVRSVGQAAFGGCDNLKTIIFAGDPPSFSRLAFEGLSFVLIYPSRNLKWEQMICGSEGYGAMEIFFMPYCVDGHLYESVVTPPTCTDEGYTTYVCACGEFYIDDTVPPLGGEHQLEIFPGVPPSCSGMGHTESSQCKVCGAVVDEMEALPPLGHNFENGTCTRCGQWDDSARPYIHLVYPGTTARLIIAESTETGNLAVWDGDHLLSDNDVVGTGMVVRITQDGETVNGGTVVVTGDTNGDGRITITDMLAVKSHLLNITPLESAAFYAGDISGDDVVTITDFLQIKAEILGITS